MNVPDEDTIYEANIEALPNGMVCAEIIEFPGCYAMAKDAATAIELVAMRIPAYYDWLRSHDAYTPIVHGPYRAIASETQSGTGESFGQAFFAADARPVTDEDLDWLTALLEWSLDDVVRLGEKIDPTTHDVHSTYGMTRNELLARAALTEAKLLNLLSAHPDPDAVTLGDAPMLDQLHELRGACLQRMRDTSPEERSRVFDAMGGHWSLRKVLRRGILAARMLSESLGSVVPA